MHIRLWLAVFILPLAGFPHGAPGMRAAKASTALITAWHEQLPRYVWSLQQARSATGTPLDAFTASAHPPLQLIFSNGRLRILHACNAIGGNYTVRDNHLHVSGLLHTMMACADPALNRMEKAALHAFHGIPRLALTGATSAPYLQLLTSDGETLLFAGTLATRPAQTSTVSPAAATSTPRR